MIEVDNDPWHTAIHEAGHAVIGRKLGLLCGQASVDQDDDSAGHSINVDPYVTLEHWWACGLHYREFRSVIVGRILVLMAGAEAESVILGQCEGGDLDDRHNIARTLDDIGAAEARLRQTTRALVRRHRSTIEQVASRLCGMM